MILSNFREAQPGKSIAYNLFTVDVQWGSANAAPFELRPAHTGADAFDDQRTFEFRNRGDDDDNRSTEWPFCVDRLALGNELDAKLVQLIEHLQKMLRASRQTVAAPDQDDVESMPVRVLK
jgi:hypothetical protein